MVPDRMAADHMQLGLLQNRPNIDPHSFPPGSDARRIVGLAYLLMTGTDSRTHARPWARAGKMTTIETATYRTEHWRADIQVAELESGKFQGMVLLLHEGRPISEQAVHRTGDVSDTQEGALVEAKVLANRMLGELW
jgi:hypothetical protein